MHEEPGVLATKMGGDDVLDASVTAAELEMLQQPDDVTEQPLNGRSPSPALEGPWALSSTVVDAASIRCCEPAKDPKLAAKKCPGAPLQFIVIAETVPRQFAVAR